MNIEDFKNKLTETDEDKQYLNIIQEASVSELNQKQGRKYIVKGYERHHIFPVSLGGGNDENNLIYLSVYQHVLAHVLLAKALPCDSTYAAVLLMSGKRRGQDLLDVEKITLEDIYHWVELRKEAVEKRTKRSPEQVKKFIKKSQEIRKAKYGNLMGPCHSVEVIERRLQNVARKYEGDTAGQLHTDSSKERRRATMRERYGNCTKHMLRPEALEKRKESIRNTTEVAYSSPFIAWCKANNISGTKKDLRVQVKIFLKERHQTKEEYLNTLNN